ncbi:hypothetical protein D3C80_1918630 [compost metagenome]
MSSVLLLLPRKPTLSPTLSNTAVMAGAEGVVVAEGLLFTPKVGVALGVTAVAAWDCDMSELTAAFSMERFFIDMLGNSYGYS